MQKEIRSSCGLSCANISGSTQRERTVVLCRRKILYDGNTNNMQFALQRRFIKLQRKVGMVMDLGDRSGVPRWNHKNCMCEKVLWHTTASLFLERNAWRENGAHCISSPTLTSAFTFVPLVYVPRAWKCCGSNLNFEDSFQYDSLQNSREFTFLWVLVHLTT